MSRRADLKNLVFHNFKSITERQVYNACSNLLTFIWKESEAKTTRHFPLGIIK